MTFLLSSLCSSRSSLSAISKFSENALGFFIWDFKPSQKVYFLRNPIDFIFYSIAGTCWRVIIDFCFAGILLPVFSSLTTFYSRCYLTFFGMIRIILQERAPRAKNLALAVEDSGRLFSKVDTAAPGKAVLVMRTSRFHPYSSERALLSTRECVT